jgi:hypothetical protein
MKLQGQRNCRPAFVFGRHPVNNFLLNSVVASSEAVVGIFLARDNDRSEVQELA